MAFFITVNIRVIYLICNYLACFFTVFLYRERKKITTATDKGKIVLTSIVRTVKKHFPELFDKFGALPDKRKKREYSMAEICAGALFMFLFKESSRNAYNNDRREKKFRNAIYTYCGIRLPQGDTVDEVLRALPPNLLEILKAQLVSRLIEKKLFCKFRLFNKYYSIAVDATGMATFDKRHCPHCLTKTSKNGKITYFHYVLEAKLVTSSGHSISIATEFIENLLGRDYEKQDCEQKAFVRLAAKIKKYYPRLPICILADGLYPNSSVFDICRKNQWGFIITLKDGSLKTFNTEVGLLKAMAQKRSVYRADKNTRTTLDYTFLNDIEYNGHNYSWILCNEKVSHIKTKHEKTQQFAYITNIPQSADNVVATADNGRVRWKIENEGFNSQKNHGYELEHKYSRVSHEAMQNYYQLLQIAHMINQLVERTCQVIALMALHSKQTIVDLWKKLYLFLMTFQEQTNSMANSIDSG